MGWLAECRWRWLKNLWISLWIKHFQVDMSEAESSDLDAYPNFNTFFTRALKEGARPLADGSDALLCPADGAISQLGRIGNGRIFQAKGRDYSLVELLGGDRSLAHTFDDGHFATIYLSPRDYHRVHMPVTGTLRSMHYIPGKLFSVNATTAARVPSLFARNERAVCIFEGDNGPFAMILVGAMIVAGIETVWDGQVAPPTRSVQVRHYPDQREIVLQRGEEMGRFKLGSTVILLFGRDQISWLESFQAGSPTRMGEALGQITSK
ncbi:phosphatidylserine decarboxylase [Spongiibacter nanhainus]|uniref:Phosphatidylserine decarboxylase proenzyme n=2 Tax=Spongiibacter nanhainus TaxID=2794344 RepID=A0A7T4R4J0_9GAMM|nr:phosphatidylserine decarboxylase [Spongiibacter nanhainus]